jgi:transcriptional regulator with XRE-family HTH domain
MTPESQSLTTKIGLRLRAARKERQLSLQSLSERTGGDLSKSRISNYEQGLRRLGIEEARLISKALGTVSPTYLLCLDDDEEPLNEQEQKLLHCFRRTDDRGRETILEVASSQCDSAEK